MLEMVKIAAKALDDKKAVDIKVIKIGDLTVLADYFVICNGTSTTQIKSLADEVEFKMEEAGYKISHREGKSAGNWILLDYHDIMVHIYNKEMREFYDLERFWRDGEFLELADLI